jgi:hypothetical protein
MGKAHVTVATKNSNFWGHEGGNAVVYVLDDGPAKHEPVFVSEACAPTVHVGQQITSKTVVCRMSGDEAFPGIETGWSSRKSSEVPAAWRTQYVPAGHPDGSKTAYGVSFSHLLGRLGAPEGNTHPIDASHISTNPHKTIGSVPLHLARLETFR